MTLFIKKCWLVALIIIGTSVWAAAQKKAVTEDGEEVILNDDGTWSYASATDEDPETVIPINPNLFKKPENAAFLLKSQNVNLGFWLDSKKWTVKKGQNNEDAEFELRSKKGDIYAMVISESIDIPLTNLKAVALENARSVASDLTLVNEEFRNVNGIQVLCLQMDGTLSGIKFSYFGYYYSNENGTVQFITYSSQKVMRDNKLECEELLNGLVEIPK